MFKKALFALYTPMFSVILLLAAMLFAFNTNYESIKTDTGGILAAKLSTIISSEVNASGVDFEQVKAACSLNANDIPAEYEFLREVCEDIRAGKITTIEEAKDNVVQKSKEAILSEMDRVKKDADVVSMVAYVAASIGYLLYLALIFFARKEGIVFYGAVVLITLLLILWGVDLLERAVVATISNEVVNNLEPKYSAPVLEMLKYFRDQEIPIIRGEGFNLTAILLIAPIAVWAVHRLTFGVKK